MAENWQKDLFRDGTLMRDGLEDIFSSGKLRNQDIAFDLANDSKFTISTLTKAITETANPELRNILGKHLKDTIQEHFKLADLLATKNWYQFYASPQQQLQADVNDAKTGVNKSAYTQA